MDEREMSGRRAGRRLLLPALVCALGLAAGAQAVPAAAKAAPVNQFGLTQVSRTAIAPRSVALVFRTAALTGTTRVSVLLPTDYASTPHKRYPVLYLLDGCCNSYNTWIDQENVDALTAGLPLIVVMADSGEAGFYTDWYNGGAGGPPEWETYYIDQLLPWIDAHFRTTGAQRGRALAGMSMGGFGAMSLAARHPDLFTAAASFSGLVNLDDPGGWSLVDLLTPLDGGSPGAIFGDHATEAIREVGSNPWDLAENLRGLTLVIRTGNGLPGGPLGYGSGIPGFDPIEANVAQESLEFHQQLDALGQPNVYDDYGPGNHSAPYWQRDLQQTLPEFMQAFAHPAKRGPVTFTSIEPAYSVYGWTVQIKRDALEFSTLRSATAAGFSVSGSGWATVTTSALYRRRSRHLVAVTSPGQTTDRVLRAGSRGRLRIMMFLGPPNPYQADTPQADVSGTKVYTTTVGVGPRLTARGRRPRP
jgi:S-formylglutathione hydrolase FrmB